MIGNKSARFAAPSKAEGFDDIRKVSIVDDCFKVEEEE